MNDHSSDPSAGGARERIAAQIRARIAKGQLKVGDRLPSESELSEEFGVARMTIHSALAGLARQGLLTRRPGAGTRVAAPRTDTTLFEVRNIREEIEALGGVHTTRVVQLKAEPATAAVGAELELPKGTTVYHSLLVHLNDGVPAQIEDRYVNPTFAPNYLDEDYTRGTPYDHLMGLATLDEVEHTIEAGLADRSVRRLLDLGDGEPVLHIHRRTWSRGMLATTTRFTYPGRYRITGRFKPGRPLG
jgi:GntR family histidine utilization transcriptional repressor